MSQKADDTAEAFPYLSERYGVVTALRDRYPNALREDPVLAAAVANLTLAELALNGAVQRYFEANPDEEV